MDIYKSLADDYDLLQPKEEILKQKPFFEEIIRKYKIKTCLDCACGTGWHLSMLDSIGLKCYGSDISNEMLNIAKDNLKAKNIILKKGDFKSLDKIWKIKFDMIVCMSTSFPHMLSDLDVMASLKSMYYQLKDNGILIIDNGISDKLLKTKPKFIPARILKDTAFYFFLEYPDRSTVIFNILQVNKTKDSFDHNTYSMSYNAIGKSKFDKYFKKTDFKKVSYFDDFKFSSYSVRNSDRLIVLAQK
jgi:ubiquinone/menaquinone biosynthesis C-methylase UbiE